MTCLDWKTFSVEKKRWNFHAHTWYVPSKQDILIRNHLFTNITASLKTNKKYKFDWTQSKMWWFWRTRYKKLQNSLSNSKITNIYVLFALLFANISKSSDASSHKRMLKVGFFCKNLESFYAFARRINDFFRFKNANFRCERFFFA